jgi:chemotaxis protein CheX
MQLGERVTTLLEISSLPDQLSRERVECVVKAVADIGASVLGETPVHDEEIANEQVLICEGVLGIISLVGDVEWSLVLGLPSDTAPALTERFAGFAIPFESEDMGDAVGELTNLFAGEVKVHLDRIGLRSDISLPQVFRGAGIEVLRLPNVPSLALTFQTSCGSFFVAIAAAKVR